MSVHTSLLTSISQSLASTYRKTGPKLISDFTQEPVGGIPNSTSDVGKKIIFIHHNASPTKYYKYALQEPDTLVNNTGALVSYSGAKTGRCPKDRRVVFDANSDISQNIWWYQNGNNSPNFKMDKETFLINRETTINYLTTQDHLFVVDGYAGWDNEHRIKVRLIAERPYHAFFMRNMLVIPTPEELETYGEPDFTIFNAGRFPCNRYTSYMTSSTTVDFSMERQEILILGTQYAGEMKKGIFSVMYYLMAQKGILTLHSSANTNLTGDNVALFFGLSGTGKTTLSADPRRKLIGDDEHCWTDSGVFNIEGGCYAKCIKLSPEKEPDIFQAIRFGAILENVDINNHTGLVDYNSNRITNNTRASYPLNHINNVVLPAVGGHPSNVIFLTCDAFGLLPLVSKLTLEQAMYHFLSGYTSKIAGTEDGVSEPTATFSACFGEPFLMCHPFQYCKMLYQKIKKHKTNVWLVNTGWIQGKFNSPNSMRCPLKLTRQIINDIHSGEMVVYFQQKKTRTLPIFELEYLTGGYTDEYNRYLDPQINWGSLHSYLRELQQISQLFKTNYNKYDMSELKGISKLIEKGGPRDMDIPVPTIQAKHKNKSNSSGGNGHEGDSDILENKLDSLRGRLLKKEVSDEEYISSSQPVKSKPNSSNGKGKRKPKTIFKKVIIRHRFANKNLIR